MAIKTRSELLDSIAKLIDREHATDEQIAILEDVTDTLNDYESKTNDKTDWKNKYEELDSTWKKRYTERFFNNDTTAIDETILQQEETTGKTYLTFDDLFKK